MNIYILSHMSKFNHLTAKYFPSFQISFRNKNKLSNYYPYQLSTTVSLLN